MTMHSYTNKTEAAHRLPFPCIICFLILAFIAGSAQASELEEDSQNPISKSIAGNWAVVEKSQGIFDDISTRHNAMGGKVEKFQVKTIPMQEFWDVRQVKQIEAEIKKLAAQKKHEIIATGYCNIIIAEKPLAGGVGFFMLTQKDGESFLCSLNIDGSTFEPSRIHYIPGKKRAEDLLIVEFGAYVNSRQVAIFQYDDEISDKPSAEKKENRNWSGRFEFRNKGAQGIRVSKVTNFKGYVSCGNLGSGSTASLNLGRMQLVEEFKVNWKERGELYSRQLTLKDIPSSERKGRLILEYSGSEEWRVYFEETAY